MPECTDCEVAKLNLANAQTALAHAVAERDALAKRWEAFYDWLYTPLPWDHVDCDNARTKMRELEGAKP